ncbi:hypothetical protein AAG570_001386, partial [Ranatra chinensis]
VVGDSKNGAFNLRVVNASLEDDAEFQCQVGPNGNNKPIRANARLSVISPPSSIEMVNHSPNSKIEIKENEEFQLECLVKNSKPAAKIIWYRGHVELKLDKREDKVTEVDIPSKKAKRYNVSSKIKLQPTAEDDYADYTCEARHEALLPDMPLRVTVQLSVLYPPGLPYIEGYTAGETIRRGQTMELVCRSRGGNPPAQLIWYRNGEQTRMTYRTAGRLSENIYTFTADTSDNKAKYRCEASNVMSPSPLKAEVQLIVLFAPSQVTISGPTEARVGEVVSLSCTTAPSNPPADIKWMIGGRQVRNATQRTVVAGTAGAGWVTTSNTTALMPTDQRSLVVICHGLNRQLTENIVSTHTINVLYPPGQPMISGYTRGSHIAVGTVQKISCISSGGNPLATLTWYKNDKRINSVSKVTDRSISAEVTILANVTDNEAIYKCEASNSATEIPLIETIQLSVHFAPEHVRIRKDPEEMRSGTLATLTCDASSSNPPAILSWWREGIPVTEGITNTTKPGLHGGTVSSIQMKLNVTPEIDKLIYTCQATNTALQRSVHDALTMHVLYKPVFTEVGDTELVGIEGSSLVIGAQAVGHPPAISYTWTKDRSPLMPLSTYHLVVEGPLLNFTRLNRSDTGVYTCEAVNSEGSTSVVYNLTVQYGSSVLATSEAVSVSVGEDAELWCRVDGWPLTTEHQQEMNGRRGASSNTSTAWNNRTSYLIVRSVTREDTGQFQCTVNNGLGNQSSATVYLIVRHKPEIDESPSLSKAASNSGDTGRLVCRVSSAPQANFTWSREGSVITPDISHKYLIEYKQIDAVHFESVLKIRSVELSDYGRYECVARNELGFASTTVRLSVTTVPDPPTSLAVHNISHDSLTLGWVPGFDGGLPATYRLRYRQASVPNANYRNICRYEDTGNATRYVVTGLELGTQYVFSVMAQNRLGSSRYLPDNLKATTSNVAPPSLPSRGTSHGGGRSNASTGSVIGSILGAGLLLLNVFLVACCLRHRHNNKRPPVIVTGTSEQGSNKSATIEMYAPSSYNETVTGETLSSVSEKSESYSDSNPDYTEEARKAATSTYLIEQVEYPFQYPGYDLQHQLKDPEPIGLHRNMYNHNGVVCLGGGLVDSYYPDARYVAYPPPVQFATGPPQVPPLPQVMVPPPLQVPPPDVTVLTGGMPPPTPLPPPLLSTFNSYSAGGSPLDSDAHLV